MAKRKYRATWDDVAFLDADHIARWGAFRGYCGAVHFDGVTPEHIMLTHDAGNDIIAIDYQLAFDCGRMASVQTRVQIERRPCRFGGTRVLLVCPRCGRSVLRLALLAVGGRCGICGELTWASRRATKVQRLVRRADKLAQRLGLEHYRQTPLRPPRMRLTTYLRIIAELMPLCAEIERRAAERLAHTREPFAAMRTLARWGL